MKIKIPALILIVCLIPVVSFSQNNTSSPYSIRGFGELEPFVNAFSRALGGVSNGIRTQRTISLSNPASLAALKHVSLDFGFRGDFSRIYNETAARSSYNGNFNYFGLAFPVYRKQVLKDSSGKKIDNNKLYREYKTVWSLGFGINPYSNINVSYSKVQDTFFGQTGNYYSRRGGLNRLYLINAINVKPELSIGLNTSFLFGQTKTNESYYLFDSQVSRATFNEKTIQLSGFRFELGIQGERNRDTIVRRDSVFESGKMIYRLRKYPVRFVYGATITNHTSMQYNEFRQVLNRSNYYSVAPIDTIISQNNVKGSTRLPLAFSAGFSVTFNKKWMIAADYRSDLWSKTDQAVFIDSFTNSSQFNFGLAFRPDIDPDFSETMKSKGRKARFEYRLGFRLLNTGYLFKDNSGRIAALKEYGISFGIGIPKTRMDYDGKTKVLLKSMFNFTGEYIHRGSTLNGMIAEDVYRITIGFTMSDIWFKQRKFN